MTNKQPKTVPQTSTLCDDGVATQVATPTSSSTLSYSWLVTVMIILMRMMLGGVFTMSGFVKAVDPWGTYYKFNEYFMAMGLESLTSLSLFFAFAIAVLEFVLGIMILTGSCRRGAIVMALAIMAVMTPLTLWLAVTDAVPDCGCFGDFLVLSNWATFGKNVVLVAGLIYLLCLNCRVSSVYGPAVQWMVILFSSLFSLTIAFVGYFTQPLLDFRPYKTGTHLMSRATSSDENDYIFVYEKDGVEHEFTIDSIPDDESGWNFVTRKEVPVAQSQPVEEQSVRSLSVWDNGDDVSDELFSNDQLLLFLLPDLDRVSVAYTFRINELQEFASQHGAKVVALTSGSDKEIAQWNDISMAHYPMYMTDDSEIKMLARGNPAVVYVREGKIEWKRTLQSIDPEEMHKAELSLITLSDDFEPSDILYTLIWLYVVSMLLLLLVNRTHVLVWHAFHKKR